jgi:hypothetical protein
LYPSLENTVNLNTVGKKEEKKGLLSRIFHGKDKDEKKEKDKK